MFVRLTEHIEVTKLASVANKPTTKNKNVRRLNTVLRQYLLIDRYKWLLPQKRAKYVIMAQLLLLTNLIGFCF